MIDKVDWKSYKPNPLVGVDEVGRGCLAGPVYAGAVILCSDEGLDLLTDSKKLSENQRDDISKIIFEHHKVGIGFATVDEIEKYNILQASLIAMQRAVKALGVQEGHLLIDGKFKIPDTPGFSQTTFIKGDLRVAPISAASIAAKVTRDNYMKELALKYPKYGLEQHKGYSTELHKKMIALWGPAPIHRKTFAGVKEYI